MTRKKYDENEVCSELVGVWVTPVMLAWLDEFRGDKSRPEVIRDLISKRMGKADQDDVMERIVDRLSNNP